MYQYEKIQTDDNVPIKMYHFSFEKEPHDMLKHWHNSLEIVFPMVGSLHVWHNKQEYILPEGEMLIVNSRDIHQFYWIEDTPYYNGYCVQINYDYIKKCLKNSVGLEIRFKQPQEQKTKEILKDTITKIAKSYHTGSSYGSLLIESEVLMLLYILCNQLIEKDEPVISDKHKKKISEIVNYMEAHFNEDISMEAIAEHFEMSNRYFSKFFRENIGIPPKEYLTLFRLRHATHLLEKTDYPVIDIAYACGFTSLSSFYKFFSRTYKQSPAQYRKNI